MKPLHQVHAALSWLFYGQGAALVPPSINPHWAQRRALRELLTVTQTDCVLDVGANEGQYATELRLIGYKGTIVSFEPARGCYDRLLARSASDPCWQVINCALGSEPGQAQLNEMRASHYNSFRQPTASETDAHTAENVVVDSTNVAVDTLDRVLPALQKRHGFSRPFLKMDTQGFDAEVFRGGAKVRDRFVALQSELSFKRIYKDAPIWHEAIAEYEAGGFTLVSMHKVNHHIPQLIECDCHMVRSDLLP